MKMKSIDSLMVVFYALLGALASSATAAGEELTEHRTLQQVKYLANVMAAPAKVADEVGLKDTLLIQERLKLEPLGGVDPELWHVLLDDDDLVLVSRQEFPVDYMGGLKLDRDVCLSHIPKAIPFQYEIVGSDGARDPVFKKNTSIVAGTIRVRIVLFYDRENKNKGPWKVYVISGGQFVQS